MNVGELINQLERFDKEAVVKVQVVTSNGEHHRYNIKKINGKTNPNLLVMVNL